MYMPSTVTLTSVCMVRESSLCHGRSRAWDWLYIYTHRDTVGARLTIYMYTHTNTLGVNDLLHIYKHRHRHRVGDCMLCESSLCHGRFRAWDWLCIYTHTDTIGANNSQYAYINTDTDTVGDSYVHVDCGSSPSCARSRGRTPVCIGAHRSYQYVKRMSFQLFADMSHELYVHVRHDQLYVHVRRDIHVHIVGRDVRIHIIRDSHLRKV